MKALSELTVKDIEKMDYNNLISLVKETNRAPGGYKTISSVINNSFINGKSRILEIGTSTGVTAIEISKIKGCQIEAIDINERSLKEARARAEQEGVANYINFKKADAQNLEYDDCMFDMVFCGNVTSLIPDRNKALQEYVRVLKDDGILAAVPMYYIKEPEQSLLNDVSAAIQTKVEVHDREYWSDFYKKSNLVLKYVENYRFDYISDKVLDEFISYIVNRDFLMELKPEVYQFLKEKYAKYIYLFRDNLSHMGYSILLYKKEKYNQEPELFRGSLISEEN